MHFNEPGS